MADSFYLLLSIPDSGKISAYPLRLASVSLGRGPGNHIQVIVPEVSTFHTRFHKTDSGFVLEDCNSTNGTRVNNLPLSGGMVELCDRDVIYLGETLVAYFVNVPENAETSFSKLYSDLEAERISKSRSAIRPVVSKPKPLVARQTDLTRKPPVRKMTRSAYEAMQKTRQIPESTNQQPQSPQLARPRPQLKTKVPKLAPGPVVRKRPVLPQRMK